MSRGFPFAPFSCISAVAMNPFEGAGKSDTAYQSVLQSEGTVAMRHWMDSDQLQGICTESHPSIEITSDVAPCTPMRTISQQKPQSHGTPESSYCLPSLFLGIGSSERQKKAVVDALSQTSQVPVINGMLNSQQFCLQQLPAKSNQFAASTPSKNLKRIQLEVKKEGPELHKENLLSLSLSKQERRLPVTQNSESVPVLGQQVGQPPPQRILPSLGASKLSLAEVTTSHEVHFPQLTQPTDGLNCRSMLLPDIDPLQLLKPVNGRANASSAPKFSEVSDSKQFSLSAKSLMVGNPIFGGESAPWVYRDQEMKFMSASMDTWKSLQGVSRACTTGSACTTLCLPVEQDLCLAKGMQKECVKYRQLQPAGAKFFVQEQQIANDNGDKCVDSYGSVNPEKRCKSPSPRNDLTSWEPDDLLADCSPGCKELRDLNIKKRKSLEQLGSSACALDATELSAQMYGKSQRGDFLPEFSEQHKLCTEDNECKNLGFSTWRESMEKHGVKIRTSQGECVDSQLSPFYAKEQQQNRSGQLASTSVAILNGSSLNDPDIVRHLGRVSSDLAGEFNAQSGGLKLFTTPAYAQMPKALSTFSVGEPSLPLSLELSRKLPDARAGKTPTTMGSKTDVD